MMQHNEKTISIEEISPITFFERKDKKLNNIKTCNGDCANCSKRQKGQ